jgi:hypothetical protein
MQQLILGIGNAINWVMEPYYEMIDFTKRNFKLRNTLFYQIKSKSILIFEKFYISGKLDHLR